MAQRTGRRCRRSGASAGSRSAAGTTTSFEIIVASAVVSTMIIPSPAEKPPRNTSHESALRPPSSGSDRTNVSACDREPEEEPPERDRQDEDVHREEVRGEEPHRGAHVPLVGRLHHGDVELARRRTTATPETSMCRSQVGDAVAAEEVRHRGRRRGGRLAEHVREAVEAAVRHVQPGGGERDELHHRLRRERDHEAGVALRRADAPEPEHGEDHEERDERRADAVPHPRIREVAAAARHEAERRAIAS